MQSFESYVRRGKVKEVAEDPGEAENLIKYALEDFDQIETENITDKNASMKVKNVYDCLRRALQSFLAMEGYNPYSHEAIIAYALENDIVSKEEANKLDKYRKLRNDISYNAERANSKEAEDIVSFAEHILPRLEEEFE